MTGYDEGERNLNFELGLEGMRRGVEKILGSGRVLFCDLLSGPHFVWSAFL